MQSLQTGLDVLFPVRMTGALLSFAFALVLFFVYPLFVVEGKGRDGGKGVLVSYIFLCFCFTYVVLLSLPGRYV